MFQINALLLNFPLILKKIYHGFYKILSSTTGFNIDNNNKCVLSIKLVASSQFNTQDLKLTTSTDKTPLFSFCPLTEAEVSKLLLSSHPTTCPLDPMPSHLLQAISPALLPALTHIINTSLLTGIFPTAFKQAQVTPLLKKTHLTFHSQIATDLSLSFHS